jgi:NAD(P)-dependent dehydrogenase (short-subunit alcohol dehydrogenase family)
VAARPTDLPVVILTGPAHGVARALAASGHVVVIAHLRAGAADAVVEEIERAGGGALAIRAGLDDELDVERLFDEAIAAFGGVDAIVHTGAGAAVVDGQAARRLRPGGAIFSLPADDRSEAALLARLRAWRAARDPTGGYPGANGRGIGDRAADTDPWRHR